MPEIKSQSRLISTSCMEIKCGRGLAPDGGLWADQDVGLEWVHIHCCGNGHLGFRSYSGSLLEKSPKSNQKGSCPTTRHLA